LKKMKLMTSDADVSSTTNTVQIPNDADVAQWVAEGHLQGADCVELHFPQFTDGRAYSQALLLRRRFQFAGDIRATGEVLADQLVHMQRSGFSSAVLAEGVDVAIAQRQLERFTGFYQGDVLEPKPLFAREALPSPPAPLPPAGEGSNSLAAHHLDALEEETIYILREVAASFERPTLLFSGGKDSLVMLRCAEKAFGVGRIPYPLLMIDTGHNFPEVTDFRDRRARELGAELIVRSVEDSMARGTVRLAHPGESRNAHQSVTLLEAIEEFRFDALIGGARRDEEKARAKERIFSHRDSFGQWQPKAQRPELWTLFNTRLAPGEHFRVFPISNWTELDVWQYIDREVIALPSLYYSHRREIVERKGLLVPVTPLTPAKEGEAVEVRDVRFRTVGDITCTCPVASLAANAADIVRETLSVQISERGATRMDDQTSDASMEKRKQDGYF